MGKSKSRILRKGINNQIPKITREEAVMTAVQKLEQNNILEAKDTITMFGLHPEELLEAGASYESVTSIKNIFNDEN